MNCMQLQRPPDLKVSSRAELCGGILTVALSWGQALGRACSFNISPESLQGPYCDPCRMANPDQAAGAVGYQQEGQKQAWRCAFPEPGLSGGGIKA